MSNNQQKQLIPELGIMNINDVSDSFYAFAFTLEQSLLQ